MVPVLQRRRPKAGEALHHVVSERMVSCGPRILVVPEILLKHNFNFSRKVYALSVLRALSKILREVFFK